MSKANINIVLNTVAASGADLTRPGGGRVLVTGDSKGFLRPKVKSITVKPFIVETLADIDVTATSSPAAATTYGFLIEQAASDSQMNKLPKKFTVQYLAPVGVTAAILGAAFTAQVQALIDSGELQATATVITGGNGGVTIAGVAGASLIKVTQPIAMTVANGYTVVASTATDFAAVAATGVVTVEVAATTGLAVGQLHYVTWTGAETINGKTGTQGVILRVSAILSGPARVQYIATSVSANITGEDGTLQRVASEAVGLGADIVAERGYLGQNADIVAANVYHEVVVDYLEPTGSTMTQEDGAPIEKHYFLSTTGGSNAANALDLLTQFGYVDAYLNAAGNAADPLLM